ncbi:ComEC family competence protein [Gillisia sp. M10.2A]|uniref:ComEC family competence protein n=1 Tax=Gillisia lutea TaxID=2909668 RepID=A0ABS9EHD9_9FLAO|nr:ComEC family competence protein [Gillisia lutea]
MLPLFLFSFFRARKQLLQDPFFGIISLMIFLFLGIFSTALKLPENQQKHYSHYLSESTSDNPIMLTAEVNEVLKTSAFQHRYVLRAFKLNNENVDGKILLNVTKDSLNGLFKSGDQLLIASPFTKINSPSNPYQFNYRSYMENLGVYHQINITHQNILKLKNENYSPRSYAGIYRSRLIKKLNKYHFKQDEMAIIQALLLGERQELSPQLNRSYIYAGAIHILAISGLHIGILLLLLTYLFKPIEVLPYGKVIKTVVLLLFLWGFALLTGLSPSVVRAVSMFSFIAIGMQLGRKTNLLNTLVASIFILLLINPYFILQPGFQLSYAAVFSIAIFQPAIKRLYQPKLKGLRYLWSLINVSLAAQIGVLPLSLYYFHQFPALFLLTNLVVLPFLGVLLAFGIVILILASLSALPEFLAIYYGQLISLLNHFISWVASKETFVFQDIHFSARMCISFYIFLLSIIPILKKRSFRNLAWILLAVIGIQLSFIFEKSFVNSQESIVFQKSKMTILGIRERNELNLYHNSSKHISQETFIKSYKTALNIKRTKEDTLKNIYNLSGKTLFIIDSSSIYNVPKLHPDIVLLSNSPKLNLERVLARLRPKLIIADGSNFKTYIAKWKQTAENEKIPFHATAEKGGFIIDSANEVFQNN